MSKLYLMVFMLLMPAIGFAKSFEIYYNDWTIEGDTYSIYTIFTRWEDSSNNQTTDCTGNICYVGVGIFEKYGSSLLAVPGNKSIKAPVKRVANNVTWWVGSYPPVSKVLAAASAQGVFPIYGDMVYKKKSGTSSGICVAPFISQRSNTDASDMALYGASSCYEAPQPPQPPPPKTTCSLNGDIYLRHGSLAENTLAGNTVSSNVLVSCSSAAAVLVQARSLNGGDIVTLRQDGSLKTLLKVNGNNGDSGVRLSVPGTSGMSVKFSSTLSTNGPVNAGDFSATAIAILTII